MLPSCSTHFEAEGKQGLALGHQVPGAVVSLLDASAAASSLRVEDTEPDFCRVC